MRSALLTSPFLFPPPPSCALAAWGTVGSMMWADYNSPLLLTDEQANFIASHYC